MPQRQTGREGKYFPCLWKVGKSLSSITAGLKTGESSLLALITEITDTADTAVPTDITDVNEITDITDTTDTADNTGSLRIVTIQRILTLVPSVALLAWGSGQD